MERVSLHGVLVAPSQLSANLAAVRALILASLLFACGGSTDDSAITADDDSGFTPAGDDVSVDTSTDTSAPAEDTATTDTSTGETTPTMDTTPPKMDAVVDGGSACRTGLLAKGLTFKTTAAKGVVDAINVTGPINGVLFASGTDTKPMGDPIACEFVETLWQFADLLKSKGFVRVGTLGSYCYRCCCAWSTTNFCRGVSDPEPDCSGTSYSNHSWGRALDVRYLYKADGTRYDINDVRHWVQSSSPTCTTAYAAQTGISRELYTVACEATAKKIFGIVLTPNYSATHRNHLHMDIGQKGTPTSWSTKALWDSTIDVLPPGVGDDHCGGE